MKSYLEFKQLLEDASVGADYEPAIVMGYYKASGRKIPPADKLEINPNEYNKVLKKQELVKAGTEIAKKLLPKVKKGKEARQLGSASLPITPFWKKYGGVNTTPKTDLIIGSHRISLKIGPAQLMSGGSGEAKATFMAALQDPKVKSLSRSKEAKVIMEEFDNFVKTGFTPSAGSVEEFLRGKKAGQDKVLTRGDKFHKKFAKDLEALFAKSNDFKIAFAREAMTGEYKFGKRSDGFAQYFLVGNKTGTNISYHSVNQQAYVQQVADLMKIDVRFKSNSQKSKGVKTGIYRYYSVLGLGITKLSVMKEEYMIENGLLFESELTEGMLKDLWNKFTNWLSNLLSEVKAWVMQSVDNMLQFFEVDEEPEISYAETVEFPM